MLGVSLCLTLRKKEMIYKFQVHISNKDLYPQETLDVINILSDIPRDIFFRLFLLYRNTYLNKDIREILNNIKQYGYWSFKKEINKKLSAYHKQQKPYHPSIESDRNILLCEVSMLELLRRELSVSPTNNNMSDLDYHARFIKAILLVNDEIFDIEDLRESDITTENVRIERMLLTNNFSFYPLTGLRDNDLGLMEIIKLLEFCRFCETNNQFNGYLFQPDGKGKLEMDNGTVFLPNDLYPLEKETFWLYYTSASTDQQTIDIYIIDSFGQMQQLTLSFNNDNSEEETETITP